jgi:DNA-binding MarR family transcriptional regulator
LAKSKINQKLAEIGITFPQLLVIKHLYEGEKPDTDLVFKSPASIAEHLGYDRPTMTGIIDRLVKQGFAVREANPSDRRSQTIVLTQKARELLKDMTGIFERADSKILAGFSEKEINELDRYLKRIIANLDE